MSFVKIHGSILDSSVWAESHTTRILWITMLTMADEDGVAGASVGGLARRAVVSKAECEAALEVLLSPDDDSRDGTAGERIEKVAGGWLILNHANYRDRRTKAQIKTAARVRRHRVKERQERQVAEGVTGNDVTAGHGPSVSEADADPEAEAEGEADLDSHTHPVSASGEIPPSWAERSSVPPDSVLSRPVRAALQDLLQNSNRVVTPDGCRRLRVPPSFEPEHVGDLAEILEELMTASARVDAGHLGVKFWRGTMLLTPNGYARMCGENAEWLAAEKKRIRLATPTAPNEEEEPAPTDTKMLAAARRSMGLEDNDVDIN